MIKKMLNRLRKEEKGQILYMTLVMLMTLVLFSYVLINVIYLATMKVKAQIAADNIALSAATLQARLLNSATTINGVIQLIHTVPVLTPVGEPLVPWISLGTKSAIAISYLKTVQSNRWLDRIFKENDFDLEANKGRLLPLTIDPVDSFGINAGNYVEPLGTWNAQCRLEVRTSEQIIGGKALGIKLPDIIVRSRAEIYDGQKPPQTSWGHDWQVRMAPPDQDTDNLLKNSTWTW